MKAIEVTGKIDSQGNLILDQPIQGTTYPHQVRVIVLVPEQHETEEIDLMIPLSKKSKPA